MSSTDFYVCLRLTAEAYRNIIILSYRFRSPIHEDKESVRMSSVVNIDFDDILKEISQALYKNSDINDFGKALGFGPAEIGRKVEENTKQGGNYMGTLDLLRTWQNRQTTSTEKAALRSALLTARFDNLADKYLSTPVTETATTTVETKTAAGATFSLPSGILGLSIGAPEQREDFDKLDNRVTTTENDVSRIDETVAQQAEDIQNESLTELLVPQAPSDESGKSPTVFLSYQWDHQPEVKAIKKHLEMAGFPCWMDIDQMGGGDQLYAKINQGIRSSKVVLCMVTEKYSNSESCNKEVNLANQLKKPIIPVLIEHTQWPLDSAMSVPFSPLLYIKFFNENKYVRGEKFWEDAKFSELLCQISYHATPDESMVSDDQHTEHISAASTVPGASSQRSKKREVTNMEIVKLSKILPDGKYSELCGILGFEYSYMQKIKKKHFMDSTAAFEELLQEWKDKGGSMKDLDAALKEAELGGLVPKYKN